MEKTNFKVGDEFIVKVIITQNPEEAMINLRHLLFGNIEICRGVKLSSIYSIGRSLETVKNELKIEVLKTIQKELEDLC